MYCTYYQCSNPDCNFRFPSIEAVVSCPVCTSSVYATLTAEISEENSDIHPTIDNFHIEALLDNIRSAWNVGSIFRTSDGFGIIHLYLGGITPTPENQRVLKTSLGAEKTLGWTHVPNSIDKIMELKEKHYFVVALERHPSTNSDIYATELQNKYPLVLVVGNEVCGIDPEILDLSDLRLSIPMMGSKKSLNVAVAFGVAISTIKFKKIWR